MANPWAWEPSESTSAEKNGTRDSTDDPLSGSAAVFARVAAAVLARLIVDRPLENDGLSYGSDAVPVGGRPKAYSTIFSHHRRGAETLTGDAEKNLRTWHAD